MLTKEMVEKLMVHEMGHCWTASQRYEYVDALQACAAAEMAAHVLARDDIRTAAQDYIRAARAKVGQRR